MEPKRALLLGAGIVLIIVIAIVIRLLAAPKETSPEASANPEASPTPDSPEIMRFDTFVADKKATITTNRGKIIIELYGEIAPNWIANFTSKAESGYYDNLTFHRVEDWVVQGGDPLGDGTGGMDIPTELNNVPFSIGAVGVARGEDINVSNDSQFFIVKSNATWLDANYTNIGKVIEGMDIVNKTQIGDTIKSITIEDIPKE